MHAQSLICVKLLGTPWTVACQALLSMGFSRQEYWSGLLFPSPGNLSNPGIKLGSFMYPALAYVYVLFAQSACTLCDLIASQALPSWDFPGKNTGLGCYFLFQGIFLTWGLNRLSHIAGRLQAASLSLVPPGKPFIHLYLNLLRFTHKLPSHERFHGKEETV